MGPQLCCGQELFYSREAFVAEKEKHQTMPTIRDQVLAQCEEHYNRFNMPETVLARKRYMKRHPTKLISIECMDGRVDFAKMTGLPYGLLASFKTMGGKFDYSLTWGGDVLDEAIAESTNDVGNAALLITYHFSRSNNAHLGCAGWGYDLDQAIEAAKALEEDSQKVYARLGPAFAPVVIGIDTDEDALRFHGEHELMLDLAEEAETDLHELEAKFHALYPSMDAEIRTDLFQLVCGNLKHIADVRESGRTPEQIKHMERVIMVGRGVMSLLPNMALTINPYARDWGNEVAVAESIIAGNVRDGRVNMEDGLLLFCVAAYNPKRGTGTDDIRSQFRAPGYAKIAQEMLKSPDGIKFDVLIGTINTETQKLHILEA
jgi:hypothetical protein